MSLQLSSRYKTLLCGMFATTFNGGAIYVYSGPQPQNADLAPTGTLLATITDGGGIWIPGDPNNGLAYTDGQGGFVVFDEAVQAVLTCVAAGTAGWARLMAYDDSLQADVGAPRIDFGVNDETNGTPAAYSIGNPELVLNETRAVSYFLYGIPPFGASA